MHIADEVKNWGKKGFETLTVKEGVIHAQPKPNWLMRLVKQLFTNQSKEQAQIAQNLLIGMRNNTFQPGDAYRICLQIRNSSSDPSLAKEAETLAAENYLTIDNVVTDLARLGEEGHETLAIVELNGVKIPVTEPKSKKSSSEAEKAAIDYLESQSTTESGVEITKCLFKIRNNTKDRVISNYAGAVIDKTTRKLALTGEKARRFSAAQSKQSELRSAHLTLQEQIQKAKKDINNKINTVFIRNIASPIVEQTVEEETNKLTKAYVDTGITCENGEKIYVRSDSLKANQFFQAVFTTGGAIQHRVQLTEEDRAHLGDYCRENRDLPTYQVDLSQYSKEAVELFVRMLDSKSAVCPTNDKSMLLELLDLAHYTDAKSIHALVLERLEKRLTDEDLVVLLQEGIPHSEPILRRVIDRLPQLLARADFTGVVPKENFERLIEKLQVRIRTSIATDRASFDMLMALLPIGGEQVKELNISNLWLTQADLENIRANCPNLEALELAKCHLQAADLEGLVGLKLQRLKLASNYLKDEGLNHLKGMPLTEIDLGDNNFTDRGLSHLKGLALTKIDLSNNKFNGAGLAHFAGMPLKSLDLFGTEVSDASLKNLKGLQLNDLTLPKTISNAGLRHLVGLPIEELELFSDRIDNAGMVQLLSLPLRTLKIKETKINIEGLVTALKTEIVNKGDRASFDKLMRVLEITGHKTLEELNLSFIELTGADLAAIKKNCPNLKTLILEGCRLKDDVLAELTGLGLNKLSLRSNEITDKGLVHLKEMQLEYLDLANNDITGPGLENLISMPLDHLGLRGNLIEGAHLHHLQYFHLTGLTLGENPITDESLSFLTKMPLIILDLDDTPVTNIGLRYLQGMPLKYLNLINCAVNDEGLETLQKLPLENLEIQGTNVSKEGAQTFNKKVKVKL